MPQKRGSQTAKKRRKKDRKQEKKKHMYPPGIHTLILAKEYVSLYENGILMAGMTGLEPATFRVTGGRSNQLSYTPNGMMM